MARPVLILLVAALLSGCGIGRAVRVLPDAADQMCRDTRPPERWSECKS